MAYGQVVIIAGAVALGAVLFVAALVAIIISPAWVTWIALGVIFLYDATWRRRRCP